VSDLSPRFLVERPMPADPAEQLDEARRTWRSLLEEQRRLARIGFELPLARCHEQVRYWGFVTRLLSLPADADRQAGGNPCPSDRR
jgi:hypothetical protein